MVLEVIEVVTGEVVYRNDSRYRLRDANVAAWSSTPHVLLAHSADVGPGVDGVWTELDTSACVSPDATYGNDVTSRIDVC
jgi:hypothetical protein